VTRLKAVPNQESTRFEGEKIWKVHIDMGSLKVTGRLIFGLLLWWLL
jgi:hypothetical protein